VGLINASLFPQCAMIHPAHYFSKDWIMTTHIKTQSAMLEGNSRDFWFLYLAWGVISVIIGLLLLLRPGTTALVWIQIMAIFWLIGGIIDLIRAIAERGGGWGWRVLAAIISILAGIFILSEPIWGMVVTVQVLFIILVINAIINGAANVFIGFRQPRSLLAIILGVFQIFIGIWLLMHPLAGMLALLPLFGIILIVFGIMVTFFAFRARRAEASAG
jgi:uncharacterized membrane protein HdeD (DUF308 family)